MKKYFLLALLMTGCNFTQPDYLTMLSPQELNAVLQRQDVFLIDVHTPEQRHIPGTDAVVPYNQIENHQDLLPKDKSTPIYLYCQGGPMGNAAARSLHDLGYQHLYNLEGGTNAWRQAGLPIQ